MEDIDKNLIYKGKLCQYCLCPTKLIDSKFFYANGISYGMMYIYPKCGAYVGCHKYTHKALGSVANDILHLLRRKGHFYFDQIWKNHLYNRPTAYRLLSEKMGIEKDYTHFGMFNEEQCLEAIKICLHMLESKKEFIYAYDEKDMELINKNMAPFYSILKDEDNM